MKKTISVIALLLCFALLWSCAPKEGAGTDSGSGSTTTAGGTEEILKIPLEDLEKYSIVYPEDATAELVKQANDLADTIKTVYGKELKVKPDTIAAIGDFKETEHEILIGHTNRAASGEYLKNLKLLDYGFTILDKKLIIGAHDLYITITATLDFAVNIVMGKKNDQNFYSTEWNKIKRSEYKLDDLKINGTDISEYKIVYPSVSGKFEKQLAERLATVIGDRSGFYLEVISDKTAKGSAPEILVGQTNRGTGLIPTATEGTKGYINTEGKTVQLFGATALGNANAVDFIIDSMDSAQEKSLDIAVSDRTVRETGEEIFSTMTFNIFTGDTSTIKVRRVIAMILKHLPDTIGVQEANSALMSSLVTQLSPYYDYVGVGRDDGKGGEHTAIFYAKEKFRTKESGTKWLTDTPNLPSTYPGAQYRRIFTYAVFENITTGKEILHLNTHLDTAGAAVREAEATMILNFLNDYRNLPIFVTGDMNTSASSAAMSLFAKAGYDNAYLVADNSSAQGSVIDHVLATSDSVDILSFYMDTSRFLGDHPSDHPAILATYSLKDLPAGFEREEWENTGNYPDDWLTIEKGDKDNGFKDFHIFN